ncbi:amidohydrolase [Proteobacteria bacterium 005FR1]|nr:amidohydrolase [Proteobacteria bacterium 005FR1]
MNNWKDLIDSAVRFRHEMHKNPELPWEEFDTANRIQQQLSSMGIDWHSCATTGTVARLAKGASGKHVALRADIDALPIDEAVDESWASQRPGCMHACGHDGHSAALIATAAWLKQHESELPGPVTLLFQPAEEGGHGARQMIDDGALEGVDEIYGWHNWPAIPLGEALCPDGAVMAGNGTFKIAVRGQGGHASQPEACRDPILAAAAITMALQQIISRRLSAKQTAVVSVTSIDGKSGDTIIPQNVAISGSIRVTEISTRDTIGEWISEIAASTASAYGVEAETQLLPRYNPTVNHPRQAEQLRSAIATEFGEDWPCKTLNAPVMASEDFSYYLEEIPGAFALIGTHTEDGFREPCHSPHYRFNDALIPSVVRVFSKIVGAPEPPR